MTTNQTIDGGPRELKPCPFCGGSADLKCTEGDYPDWFVQCTECHASVDVFGPGAVHHWNDRKLPAAQPQGEPVGYVIPGDMPAHSGYTKTVNPVSEGKYTFPLYAKQPAPVAVVPELTSELRWILGQMCFQHIHTAQALRLMGHQIARKAEDEQAVTIYWMLGHYLKDQENWRENATAEMKAAAPAA